MLGKGAWVFPGLAAVLGEHFGAWGFRPLHFLWNEDLAGEEHVSFSTLHFI